MLIQLRIELAITVAIGRAFRTAIRRVRRATWVMGSRRRQRRRNAGREQPPNRVRDGDPANTGGLLTPPIYCRRAPESSGAWHRAPRVRARGASATCRRPVTCPQAVAIAALAVPVHPATRPTSPIGTTTAFCRGSPRGVSSSTPARARTCCSWSVLPVVATAKIRP